uniref:Uncharacterized protein n=1 Tax=Zea mays TaxID=4577 RepID=A0A804UBM1_MAIZE
MAPFLALERCVCGRRWLCVVEKQGTCITIQCRRVGGWNGWMVLDVPIFSTEHELSWIRARVPYIPRHAGVQVLPNPRRPSPRHRRLASSLPIDRSSSPPPVGMAPCTWVRLSQLPEEPNPIVARTSLGCRHQRPARQPACTGAPRMIRGCRLYPSFSDSLSEKNIAQKQQDGSGCG